MEMKIIEMEMVELEEKPWKTVVNKKNKNKLIPWDTLPSLALLNIFRNLNFKDRFGSIPLVCKEWNSIISNDPRCWSSMIPDSISPDDAFIKKPDYSFQVDPPSKLYDLKSQEILRDQGVSYLRNFIKKSTTCSSLGEGSTTCSLGEGSSSSSSITSLFLDPFHFSNSDTNDSIHQDEILCLIAQCCPNLKHISFDGFYCASKEAVVEVFKRCKKIELIDFSDSGYTDSLQVIEELGKCLPNLRGLRIAGWITTGWMEHVSIYNAIATHLPRIKLLALDFRHFDDDLRKLISETECSLTELQYLSVGLWWELDSPPVCIHIPEFHCEKLLGYECDRSHWQFQPLLSVHRSKDRPRLDTSKRAFCHICISWKAEVKETYSECYFRFHDEDYSVMKQKKEYKYYLSISKEQKKKKKKTRRTEEVEEEEDQKNRRRKKKEEASFISKTKMRKKSDKYDYQDYYVQPLL